jgi:hypothetical protein
MVSIKKNIEEIEHFISQKIAHKINGISSNLDTEFQRSSTLFTNRNQTLSIESNHPFNISTIRLPQTKIFHTIIDSDFLELSIIQFYDKSIISVKKNISSSNIKICLKENIYLDGKLCNKDDKFSLKRDSIYVLSIEKLSENLDINLYINNIYKKELSLNPLKFLKARDNDILSTIDHLWGKLDLVSANRQINDVKYLFWLQEIFLHFNWMDELSQSYNNFNNYADDEYFKLCKFRLNKFLNKEFIDYSAAKDEIITEYVYQKAEKVELDILINRYWAKIAYPIRDLYFAKMINNNPDRFIALLFLAIRENLFWYPLLLDKIKKYLHDEKLLTIILLLVELKRHSNLYFDQSKFYYAPIPYSGINNSIEISNLAAKFSCCQNYGKNYTKIKLKNNTIDFSIDRNCNITYLALEKYIIAEPNIFSPLDALDYNFIKIKINDIVLKIPLLWHNFSVYYNNTRIKYLLKKKRWQISFKIGKDVKSLSIDGKKIDITNKQYLTVFHDNSIRGESFNFKFFDEYGVVIDSLSKTIKKITLRGAALKGNGLLAENINLFRGKSLKSKNLNTNEFNTIFLNNSSDDSSFRISTSKFKTVVIELKKNSGFILSLKKNTAIDLRYRLIILTENLYGEEGTEEISEIFYKNLYFYPIIKSYKNFKYDNNFYHILISEDYKKILLQENNKAIGEFKRNIFMIDGRNISKALLELFEII